MARRAISFLFLAALGCGGSSAPTSPLSPPGEMMTGPPKISTDAGMFRLLVDTTPNPPVRGVNSVVFTISDPSGAAVDGLTLSEVPWMPAHGHGTSVKPTVTPMGNGVYQIDQVLFFMPGMWELRSTLTGSNGQDHVTPSFEIP